MQILSSISTAVKVVDAKVTQVASSVNAMSERQDRLEASLEQLKSFWRPTFALHQPPALPQAPLSSQPPVLPKAAQGSTSSSTDSESSSATATS